MVDLLPPAAGRSVQLERPQEVGGVLEVGSNGQNLRTETRSAQITNHRSLLQSRYWSEKIKPLILLSKGCIKSFSSDMQETPKVPVEHDYLVDEVLHADDAELAQGALNEVVGGDGGTVASDLRKSGVKLYFKLVAFGGQLFKSVVSNFFRTLHQYGGGQCRI